ncbi:MAG: TAXI family TRAP transporter solute-binding subunit [Deltaproteobacteria bacterium]|nr:TAXI family TRAP transporter solute-binding subunit [Deltaproteobacteria bacterium]
MKKFLVGLLALSIAIVLINGIAGKGEAGQKWPKEIFLGSFPKGSVAYPTMVAVARLASKYTPAYVVVREYAGCAPLIKACSTGDLDMFMVGQDDLLSAYYGKGPWKGKPQDHNLLIGAVFLGGSAFGVRPGEGIKSIKDLAGKTVMVPGTVPWEAGAAKAILASNGILDKVKIVKFAIPSEIAPAMIDKTIDAFVWPPGAGVLTEIHASVGLDWIVLKPEDIKAARADYPALVSWRAPSFVSRLYKYPPDKVVNGVAFCAAVACRSDLPAFVAKGILDAVYSDNHINEVKSLSPFLGEYTNLENAVQYFWTPFHPGAVKFFKSKGVWTEKFEKRQQELLSKPRSQSKGK